MLRPTCHIKIGDLSFDWSNDVVIDSGWKQFTDTCELKLPGNVKLGNSKEAKESKHFLLDYISFGAPVEIQLSANGDLTTLFQGYVSGIKPNTPIALSCEDEMYQLKRNNIVDSGEAYTLKKMVDTYFSTYTVKHVDAELGTFPIDNLSSVQMLDELRKNFGLNAFFRNGVLVIGLQYDPETANTQTFQLEGEIVDDKNLEDLKADEMKLNVTAVSNNEDGTKTEVQVGDESGEKRTLNFYNLSKSALEEAANREMQKIKYDGWRGNFTAFGVKVVRHGDIVNLLHPEESQKSGSYYVDHVKYTFGLNGFRQNITLGPVAL